MGFDLVAALRAFGDGIHFRLAEGAADQEAHTARVANQALDAAGGQGQGSGPEVPGEAVIAGGAFERGNVEQCDKVAVIRRVFQLPLPVTKQAHLAASCQRTSCSGWST